MAKKELKVYLNERTIQQLKAKAEEFELEGRGWLTHLLEKIAPEEIVLMDSNAKKMLKALNLN